MIEDFDIEELEELFAEFEIEASEDGIPDPGPEKYDTKKENRKRELMQQLAFYAEEGSTWDPDGKYLCGSCYYRQVMDSGVAPACYIVEGKISMETGSCQFYRYGNPDSEVNPIPMKEKYTKEASNYAERPKVKGFGCYPRCGYGSVAEGVDSDGREIWCGQFGVHVRPKACCAFEDGKDLVQIEAGGLGSGCNPEVGKCGRPEGPEKIDYMAEKIGGAQGTNPGGMYKGSDGKYRYVKLYVDPKQSRGEYLANQLYKALNIQAPDSVLFKNDGKDAIASEQLEGKTVQQMGAISSTQARAFLSGFAADVLTANWDAVGTGMDNVFVDKTGDVYRIDNGGTFLKRAQGGEKPDSVLNQITEVKGFFDKNVYYANVAKAAGVTSVKDLGISTGTKSFVDQVVDIVKLRDDSGGWQKFVETKVPDMPPDEQKKIAGMMEARTDLMRSLALGIGKTPEQAPAGKSEGDKAPSKARDWSTPDQKLVGGYFRQGTVLAQVYTRLSSNEGQWQKISEIKKDLETKLGKSLYNISQNTLKQGGKKSGLWQLEISGDSIRMYITKPGEKAQQVADIGEDKQKIAADFAKQMMSSMQLSKFTGFFQQMGVSDESRKSFENAVKSWTGSADSNAAQNWREVAMNFYGRKPDGDYVGYNSKVIGTPMSAQKAKVMEPAALAMKAYAGEYAKINNLNVVYRNIDSPQAHDILVAMREAKASGLTQIKVNLNSLSCWSDKPTLNISSGVRLRMKIDPDNVWAAHNSSPYLFTAHPGEHEFMIGSHQPQEIFDFKDISIDDKYDTKATQQEYDEWHKDFMKAAQEDKLDPKKDPEFYRALKKAQKESKIPIANCVLDDHWMYKKKKP